MFGGDPQSITLAGHGTGAACVHFLISSMAVPEGRTFALLSQTINDTNCKHVSNSSSYSMYIYICACVCMCVKDYFLIVPF